MVDNHNTYIKLLRKEDAYQFSGMKHVIMTTLCIECLIQNIRLLECINLHYHSITCCFNPEWPANIPKKPIITSFSSIKKKTNVLNLVENERKRQGN